VAGAASAQVKGTRRSRSVVRISHAALAWFAVTTILVHAPRLSITLHVTNMVIIPLRETAATILSRQSQSCSNKLVPTTAVVPSRLVCPTLPRLSAMSSTRLRVAQLSHRSKTCAAMSIPNQAHLRIAGNPLIKKLTIAIVTTTTTINPNTTTRIIMTIGHKGSIINRKILGGVIIREAMVNNVDQ